MLLEGPGNRENPLVRTLKEHPEPQEHYPLTQDLSGINTYLPEELLRDIFLYNIEVNQIKPGQLASVCRYWRSIITSMSHLWSTLRVGTWTETEQVTIWLQRAYPKKVLIDTERDGQRSSNALPFAAFRDALASTSQWHKLTITSFPPENLASPLGFRGATPMDVLRTLHVEGGCVRSPSFTHLLGLVPTEAPVLSKLSLLICQCLLSATSLAPYFAKPHSAHCQWQRYSRAI